MTSFITFSNFLLLLILRSFCSRFRFCSSFKILGIHLAETSWHLNILLKSLKRFLKKSLLISNLVYTPSFISLSVVVCTAAIDFLLITDLRLLDCLIFSTKSLSNLEWFIWKSVNRFNEYNRVSIQRYEFLKKIFSRNIYNITTFIWFWYTTLCLKFHFETFVQFLYSQCLKGGSEIVVFCFVKFLWYFFNFNSTDDIKIFNKWPVQSDVQFNRSTCSVSN